MTLRLIRLRLVGAFPDRRPFYGNPMLAILTVMPELTTPEMCVSPDVHQSGLAIGC
jgi:hypothetical protein